MSPSPNIPAGRREQVRRDGRRVERLAARTRTSASAYENISCQPMKQFGMLYLSLRIVFSLRSSGNDRPSLIGIDKIGRIV